MEVVLLREDEAPESILKELMKGADSAVRFDCAGPRANFVVQGWFVLPKGSLSPAVDVERPA